MSAQGTVHYEQRGVIARITFDRPTARNAMTWAMYDEFHAALQRAESEASLRVLELRGAGGHFVAGTDIGQFAGFSSGDDGVAYERRLEAVVARLEHLPLPTVAVVQGNAAGAGLLFAAASDIRVCTPDARFSAPIARTVGNLLSQRSITRLLAHLGPARTKLLLMTASTLEAAEARAIGFVSDVVEPRLLEQHVTELVEKLSEMAPLTLRATKRLVQRTLDALGADADDVLRSVYGSRDFREGVTAFLEKRPPKWEGK